MIYQKRDEYLFVKETKNNNYLAHMHRQVEIFYVLDGAIEITISGKKKLLKKGMISIAFPNIVHETHTPEHSLALMIIFNHDFLPDFSAEFHTQRPQIPFITNPQNPEQFSLLISGLSEKCAKKYRYPHCKRISVYSYHYDFVSDNTCQTKYNPHWHLSGYFQLLKPAFHRRTKPVTACSRPRLQQVSYLPYF